MRLAIVTVAACLLVTSPSYATSITVGDLTFSGFDQLYGYIAIGRIVSDTDQGLSGIQTGPIRGDLEYTAAMKYDVTSSGAPMTGLTLSGVPLDWWGRFNLGTRLCLGGTWEHSSPLAAGGACSSGVAMPGPAIGWNLTPEDVFTGTTFGALTFDQPYDTVSVVMLYSQFSYWDLYAQHLRDNGLPWPAYSGAGAESLTQLFAQDVGEPSTALFMTEPEAAVPEPSVLLLIGVGCVAVLRRRVDPDRLIRGRRW